MGTVYLPFVIKPIMSSSGKGQSIVKNIDDIDSQIPPDKEVPTSNLWWAIYSGIVTVGLVTLSAARFLGV